MCPFSSAPAASPAPTLTPTHTNVSDYTTVRAPFCVSIAIRFSILASTVSSATEAANPSVALHVTPCAAPLLDIFHVAVDSVLTALVPVDRPPTGLFTGCLTVLHERAGSTYRINDAVNAISNAISNMAEYPLKKLPGE